jgi:hypothetical protein
MDKKHWLYAVAPTVAMLVAYVFLAVGLVMFFSSWLKLKFYDPQSNVYFDTCQYDYTKPVAAGDTPVTRTPAEIDECLNRNKMQNLAQYTQGKRDNMIDGGVFFVVGLVFYGLARQVRAREK